MLVHVLEESDHRRDVSFGGDVRTTSQHATHPALSINHKRARTSSSREGREGLVGPFLGLEGAAIGKVGTDVRVKVCHNPKGCI